MKNIKIATRDAVGKALVEIGSKNENVVVLDADLCGSTKTEEFKKKFPDRFFDCGIAECNMVGVGAGLACVKKIPFVASFSIFVAGRAFEQIRNSVCYTNLNVKIIGSHSGFSSGQDGATHQAIEDIAIMRAIPNITIINPSDYFEAYAAIMKAAEKKGPVYIKTSKFEVENIHDEDYIEKFEIGKGEILKKGDLVCLVATGIESYFCLKAADLLEKQNISTMVVNIHTIKPLDEELIFSLAEKTKFFFTVEEHSIIGGLGEAVASFVCEKSPRFINKIGIKDKFGESGSPMELLEKNGLDELGIYRFVKDIVDKNI